MNIKEQLEFIADRLYELGAPLKIAMESMTDYDVIDKALKLLSENPNIILSEYINEMEIDKLRESKRIIEND